MRGQLKAWVFVHNHPEGKLGKLSATAINQLKSQNPPVEIAGLSIDSLWDRLTTLPGEILERFFGAGSEGAVPISDQKELELPAEIKQLLDKADKLDVDGKYGEALLLIEEALKTAEKCGHETAIIKATIDLAECITRTRIGLERAESLLKPCLEKLPPVGMTRAANRPSSYSVTLRRLKGASMRASRSRPKRWKAPGRGTTDSRLGEHS